MKRISEKHKQYLIRRQLKQEKRRLRSKAIAKHIRQYGANSRPPAKGDSLFRKKVVTLSLPPVFNLNDAYDDSIAFIETLREYGVRSVRRFKLDFTTLEEFGGAGALVLAAELDRWRRLSGLRLHTIDLDKWNPNILRLFHEMGLFSLLDVINPPRLPETDDPVKFVEFWSANTARGELARELRLSLENIPGVTIPNKSTLFRGLSEAMSNVSNHAYPPDFPFSTPPIKGQWWMSGSFNTETTLLSVAFFDQGVGIPVTLPANYPLERIMAIINRIGLKDNDASRIRAAMELQRTSTQESYRGYGLFRDIRNFTNSMPEGRLRILSGKGEYIYSPSDNKLKNGEKILTHKQGIGGTLIQWEAKLK